MRAIPDKKANQRENMRRWRARNKAAGYCYCGNDRLEGHKTCAQCVARSAGTNARVRGQAQAGPIEIVKGGRVWTRMMADVEIGLLAQCVEIADSHGMGLHQFVSDALELMVAVVSAEEPLHVSRPLEAQVLAEAS